MATMAIEKKESYKWLRSVEETERALLGFLDSGGQVIVVADRESDIIELFGMVRHENLHLLIRSRHPRIVEVGAERSSLPVALEAVAPSGEYTITVPEQRGRPRRQARLSVKYLEAALVPPQGKRSKLARQRIWVVHAVEIDAPTNVDPLSWTLLSTLKVASHEEAMAMIDRYKRRWVIERLHFTLKTGCFDVERLRFDDYETLATALAFYFVVAWQVLWLIYISREEPQTPPEKHLEPHELLILRRATNRPILTMLEAVRAIAELAGYANYPKSPLPGIKMVWAGQRKLTDMIAGARLMGFI
jgi:hypothetical protein